MNGERNDGPLVATGSQTVGPFFHFGLTPEGVVNAVPVPPGVPRLELVVRVTDGAGQAVGDAVVEIWYAAGSAEHRPDSPAPPCMFARLPTAGDGTCAFEIAAPIRPSTSAAAGPPYVNVCLFARGLLRQLHTRIYFADDPLLEHDALLGYVPEERRATLLATRDAARRNRWLFDLRLQGPGETVFFDV
jgi:protocatechuate 3,4-dioxygenase alpha subunit